MNREAGKIQSFHPACVVEIEILLQVILKWYKKVSPVSYAYTLLTDLFGNLNRKTKVSKNDYSNSTFAFFIMQRWFADKFFNNGNNAS